MSRTETYAYLLYTIIDVLWRCLNQGNLHFVRNKLVSAINTGGYNFASDVCMSVFSHKISVQQVLPVF